MTTPGQADPINTRATARRRRLGLSVRALMVLILVIAGWLGWVLHRARVQREAVSAIEATGLGVAHDWEWSDDPAAPRRADPPWPRWLIRAVGIDALSGVASVGGTFPKRPVDDALMAAVGRLAGLKSLSLPDSTITDAGLSHLRNLTRLEQFHLGKNTVLTDAGLAHFRGLTRLRRLSMNCPGVKGPGLANIKGCTRLEYLELSRDPIGDADLAHLSGLTALTELHLCGPRITDAGLPHLRGLVNLKEFTVSGFEAPGITAAGLGSLAAMARLETLVLDGSQVASLDPIRHLTGLKTLRLGGTPLDDPGAAALAGFSRLEALNLPGTKVGDATLARLADKAGLRQLALTRTRVTDPGLAHLTGLSRLEELDLGDTHIGDLGLEHLANLTTLRSSTSPPRRSPTPACRAWSASRGWTISPSSGRPSPRPPPTRSGRPSRASRSSSEPAGASIPQIEAHP